MTAQKIYPARLLAFSFVREFSGADDFLPIGRMGPDFKLPSILSGCGISLRSVTLLPRNLRLFGMYAGKTMLREEPGNLLAPTEEFHHSQLFSFD